VCVGDRGALGDHIWVGGGGGFSTFRTNGFD
jgi:hypothetical protein